MSHVLCACMQVQPGWRQVVSDAQDGIQDMLLHLQIPKQAVVGLYLRGSVPQGSALAGVSDLDLMLYVLWPPQHTSTRASAARIARARDAACALSRERCSSKQRLQRGVEDVALAVAQTHEHAVKVGVP